MIRTLPVDSERLGLLAAGSVAAAPQWAELADGSRRPSGNQAKNDAGQLLWRVDVIVMLAERPEVIAVEVAGDEPEVDALQPIVFEGLVCRVTKGKTGQLNGYWSAQRVLHSARTQTPVSV